jgi:hypothetical protein
MTEFEKWTTLRNALRKRLAQYEAKEDKCKDELSKTCCRYAAMTVKDIIRIMNVLEEQ